MLGAQWGPGQSGWRSKRAEQELGLAGRAGTGGKGLGAKVRGTRKLSGQEESYFNAAVFFFLIKMNAPKVLINQIQIF